MDFTGQTAFITGGGGRIGRVVGRRFAEAGARVGLFDLDGARVREAAEAIPGGRAAAFAGDVSQAADVDAAVAGCERALGPVDVLVNAAGIFPNTPLLEMDPGEWDRVFAVNTRGMMLCCKAVASRLVARGAPGAIVNFSSGAGTSARAGAAHYCGSKAAVNMLTHVLAIELGPHGIRVNAVAPGLVTDEPLRAGTSGVHPYIGMMIEATPMRRTGIAEDIAGAVLFLASAESPWTTGAILEVSGGSHCGRPHVPLSRDLR
ncbi:MAG TPA: SDR family oxidoreductase [Bacillota bacterium]|nr:SDR family oxidoreductase [Bacillota bacterium]